MKRTMYVILGVLAMSSAAWAGVIANGSFETASVDPGSSFAMLNNGSTAIAGWTVIGQVKVNGAVDFIGGTWPASDGLYSLDLNGANNQGGIKQTLATEAGKTYKVLFDMSGNPAGGPDLKSLQLSAAGQSGDFSFVVSEAGATLQDMKWTTLEWTFVAEGAQTTLQFLSTSGPDSYGPALDNVRVSAVPAPGALLLGSLGAGLVGMLRRRGM